jgi:hypothetical protein
MSDTTESAELAERFRPVFAKIAEGALDRGCTQIKLRYPAFRVWEKRRLHIPAGLSR